MCGDHVDICNYSGWQGWLWVFVEFGCDVDIRICYIELESGRELHWKFTQQRCCEERADIWILGSELRAVESRRCGLFAADARGMDNSRPEPVELVNECELESWFRLGDGSRSCFDMWTAAVDILSRIELLCGVCVLFAEPERRWDGGDECDDCRDRVWILQHVRSESCGSLCECRHCLGLG